jgi:NAD(P)-dependent dehydrogenase (short-subunit alcohol dehydrogenase family)
MRQVCLVTGGARGDVADEGDVMAMFAAAERALGAISGLVNAAGASLTSRVDALNATELERLFAVNVIGLMLCCREAASACRHGMAARAAPSSTSPRWPRPLATTRSVGLCRQQGCR